MVDEAILEKIRRLEWAEYGRETMGMEAEAWAQRSDSATAGAAPFGVPFLSRLSSLHPYPILIRQQQPLPVLHS